MAKVTGFDEVYSALYVDFDNVHSRLQEVDPDAAKSFGTAPYRWVRWVENHALRILYGEGVRRRILKRVCYLNPQRHQESRNAFIRSAFQVVDCPPAAQRGRSGCELNLAIDCMADLFHPTHFDEFIILSGDTDFTPLLIRLQEHARRTLVLSAGSSSPALTAAASWRIREDWFLQQALRDDRDDGDADASFSRQQRGGNAPLGGVGSGNAAQRPARDDDEDEDGPAPGNSW